MAYVQIVDEGKTQTVEIDERAVVGRMPECTIQLQEPHASRKHAVIYRQEDEWRIRDLDTRNGTSVNGERITEDRELHPGDVVTIGKAVLTFLGDSAPGPPEPKDSSKPAVLLGDYKIVGEIAHSSYARVCKVTREGVNREMIAKVLDRRAFVGGPDNLLVTVRSLAALNHPAIASIYEVDPRGDFPYFIGEFVPGNNLAEVIAAEGRLAPERARGIAVAAAEALRAAHARGIIHGNLKPRNILFNDLGEVKLVDFGGLCPVEPSPGRPAGLASYAGIPYNLAPEQITKGPTDPRTDIYSLGAVLYSMVSGVPVFTGASDEEIMQKHLTEKPADLKQLVPDLPDDLVRTITRMLQKDPAARFQNAQGVLRALSGEHVPEQTRRPLRPEPEPQAERESIARREGNSLLAFAAGVFLIILIVATFLGAKQMGQFIKAMVTDHHTAGTQTEERQDPQ